jgi:hypothetical protein
VTPSSEKLTAIAKNVKTFVKYLIRIMVPPLQILLKCNIDTNYSASTVPIAESTVFVRFLGEMRPVSCKKAQYRVQNAKSSVFTCSLGEKSI